MVYADYKYYKESYGGNMPEVDFNRLSRKASAYIDTLTMQRAEKAITGVFEGKIKDCCCSVADELLTQEEGGEVISQSVGPCSKNFATSGKTAEQKLYNTISLYLSHTGLMYRGI